MEAPAPEKERQKSELPFGMALRIGETIEPLGRRQCEAEHHRLARRRRQAVLRRFAMQMSAIGVGNDEAGVCGKNPARQIARKGEEQAVAMRAIILPLSIGAQILDR